MSQLRWISLFCISLFSFEAQATSSRQYDLAGLVEASKLIVLGRAISHQSFWKDTRIVTQTRLEVEEVWQGQRFATGSVDVMTLGGSVGDIGQRVDGAAVIRDGQRVVVHLREGPRHDLWPVALAQGVWHIDEPSPANLLTAPLAEHSAVTRSHLDRLVGRPGEVFSPMPSTLSALRAAILEMTREK